MHHRDRKNYDCQYLMRERQRKSRLMEKRGNAKAGLQRHRAGKDHSVSKCAFPAPGIVGVQYRQKPDDISDHSVLKLHGERVFEKIAPSRFNEPQPLRRRHEGAIDGRPRVVDKTRTEPSHQRAKINLK